MIEIPESLQPYMPMIIGGTTALLIFVIGWLTSKWAHTLVAKLLRRRAKDETLIRFLAALAQYFVLAATVITALARVGVETISLVALLGSAGLAVGLALQGSLTHFASGVLLLLFRPFTIGDMVDAGGESGTVEEVGLFATVLVTLDNHKVVVPNGTITSRAIFNLTALGKRRARIDISVAHGSDIEVVAALLGEAAASVATVLEDPKPIALFTGFGAHSLDFAVIIWANNPDFIGARVRLQKAIYQRLLAEGIELPRNQIVVHQPAD